MKVSIYSEPDLARVSRLIRSDATVQPGWKHFVAGLEEFDDAKIASFEKRRQELADRAREHGGTKIFSLGNFVRSSLSLAPQLAFLWRMTGNQQALRAALSVCELALSEAEWRYQARQSGWKSDLWTAEFCSHLAVTWMQLGDALPDPERMADILWQRGILPLAEDWLDPVTRIHALDTMGHNWWSVCVSGAGLALFAVRHLIPAADEYLTQIAESYLEFFSYPGNILQNKHRTFGEQGDYIESIGYLDYTLHDVGVLFDLYRDVLGRDLAGEIPTLARVCDYYMASFQPLHDRTLRLNFGNMGAGPDTMGSYNHNPKTVWLWLSRRFRRRDLFEAVERNYRGPVKMWEFLYWPENSEDLAVPAAPIDTVFRNTGIAILRDGNTPESTVFAIKTGEIWNHNQRDAGTIILSAAGREFLIDSGAMEYSNPVYWNYLRTAEAHNLILHGNQGPDSDLDYHGTRFNGEAPVLLSAPDYRYLLADCCGPWQPIYRRFYRHVLWVDDFILLIDDLYAYSAGNWTQLWHYRGTACLENEEVRIANEGETLVIRRLYPTERRDEFRKGFLPRLVGNTLKYEYQLDETQFLATEYPDRGLREKFINLLLLPRHAEKTVRTSGGSDYESIEISDRRGTWTFICNHLADGRKMHQNSELCIDTLRTDAFLVGLHRDPEGRLDQFSIHNGSFLQLEGQTLHSSLLKIDMRVHVTENGRTIYLHSTAPTWAYFSAAGPIVQSSVPVRYRDGLAGAQLPSGMNRVELSW